MRFLEDFNIKKYPKPKKKTSKKKGSSSISYKKPIPNKIPDKIPVKKLPTPAEIKRKQKVVQEANARATKAINHFKANNQLANNGTSNLRGASFTKKVAPFIDTSPKPTTVPRNYKQPNYAFRKSSLAKWYEKQVPDPMDRRSPYTGFNGKGLSRFTTGVFKVLSSDADPRGMLSDPRRRKIHELQLKNQQKALRELWGGTQSLVADVIGRPIYALKWAQAEAKHREQLKQKRLNELYGIDRKQQSYYVIDEETGRAIVIKGSKSGGDIYSYLNSNGKALSLDMHVLPASKVDSYRIIGLIPKDRVYHVKSSEQFLSNLFDPNYNAGILKRDSKGLPYISNAGIRNYLAQNSSKPKFDFVFNTTPLKFRKDDLMLERYLNKSAEDYVQSKYFYNLPRISNVTPGAAMAVNFLAGGLNLITRPGNLTGAYFTGKMAGKTSDQIRYDMYKGFVKGADTSFTEYYITKHDKHPYLKGLMLDTITDPTIFADFIAKGGATVTKQFIRKAVKSDITEHSLKNVAAKYLSGAKLVTNTGDMTFKESLQSLFVTHRYGTVHQTRGVYSRVRGRLKHTKITADALDNALPKALLPNSTKRQLINTMITNPKQVNERFIANILHEAGFRNKFKDDLAEAIYDSYKTSGLISNTARANKTADSVNKLYKRYANLRSIAEHVDNIDTVLTKAAFPALTLTVKGAKKGIKAIKHTELKKFLAKAAELKNMPLSEIMKQEELLELTKRRMQHQVERAVEPIAKKHVLTMDLLEDEAKKIEAARRYGMYGTTDNLADIIAARDSKLIDTLDTVQYAVTLGDAGYNKALKYVKDTYEDAADVASLHEFLENTLQSNNNLRDGLVYVKNDAERAKLGALIDVRENQIYKVQNAVDNAAASNVLKDLSRALNTLAAQHNTADMLRGIDNYLVNSVEQVHLATRYADEALANTVTKRIDEVRELIKNDALSREYKHVLNQITGDIKDISKNFTKARLGADSALTLSTFFKKFTVIGDKFNTKSFEHVFHKTDNIASTLQESATVPAAEVMHVLTKDTANGVVTELKEYLPEYLYDALSEVTSSDLDKIALQKSNVNVITHTEVEKKAYQGARAPIDINLNVSGQETQRAIRDAATKNLLLKDTESLRSTLHTSFDNANKGLRYRQQAELFTHKATQAKVVDDLIAVNKRMQNLPTVQDFRKSVGDAVSAIKKEVTAEFSTVDISSLKNVKGIEKPVVDLQHHTQDITDAIVEHVFDFLDSSVSLGKRDEAVHLTALNMLDDILERTGRTSEVLTLSAKEKLIGDLLPQINEVIEKTRSAATLVESNKEYYALANNLMDTAKRSTDGIHLAETKESIQHATDSIRDTLKLQLEDAELQKSLRQYAIEHNLKSAPVFKDIRHNVVDYVMEQARVYANTYFTPEMTITAKRDMVKDIFSKAVQSTGAVSDAYTPSVELIDELLPYISNVVDTYRRADNVIRDFTEKFSSAVVGNINKAATAKNKVNPVFEQTINNTKIRTNVLSRFDNGLTELNKALASKDWDALSQLLDLRPDSNLGEFVRALDTYFTAQLADTIETMRIIDTPEYRPIASYLAGVNGRYVRAKEAAKFADIVLERDVTVRAVKANAAQVENTAQHIYKEKDYLFHPGDYYRQRVDSLAEIGALDSIAHSYRLTNDYDTADMIERLVSYAKDIDSRVQANAVLDASLKEAEQALSPELYTVYRDSLFNVRDMRKQTMLRAREHAPDFVDNVVSQHYYQYANGSYNLDQTISDLYSFSKSKLSKQYKIDKEILDKLSVGHTAGIDTYRTVLTNIVHDPDSFQGLIDRVRSGKDVFIFDTETLGLNTRRDTNHVFSIGLYKLDAARCELLKYDKELERYTSDSINKFMRALLEDADAGKGYKEVYNKLPNSLIDKGMFPESSFMSLAEFKKLYGYDGELLENAGEIFAENIANTMREMQGQDILDLHSVVLCGFNNHGFDNVVMANNCPELSALFRDVPQNIDIFSNIKAKHGLYVSDKDRNIIGNLYNTLMTNLSDTPIEQFKYAYPSRVIDSYDRFYRTLQQLGNSTTTLNEAVAQGSKVQGVTVLENIFKDTPKEIDLGRAVMELADEKDSLKMLNYLKDKSVITEHVYKLVPENERSWKTGYLVMQLENPGLTRKEYEAMYYSGELMQYDRVISNWFHILDKTPEVDVLKLTPAEFAARADELRAAADVITGGQTSNIIRWINGVADEGYDYFQTFAVQNKLTDRTVRLFGNSIDNYRSMEQYRRLTSNIQNRIKSNTHDIFGMEKYADDTITAWTEIGEYCNKHPELTGVQYLLKLQDFEKLPLNERFAVIEELLLGNTYGLRKQFYNDAATGIATVSDVIPFEFSENTSRLIYHIYDTRTGAGYNVFQKELDFFTRQAKGAAYEIANELELVRHDTQAFEEFAERLSSITGGASVQKHVMAVALQPVNELKKQITNIINNATSYSSLTDLYNDLGIIRGAWDEVHHTRVKDLVQDILNNDEAILEHLISPDFNGMMFLHRSEDAYMLKLIDKLLGDEHPYSKYLQVRYLEKEQVVAVTLNKLCDLDDEFLHLTDTGQKIARNNVVGKNMPTELLNVFKRAVPKLDVLAPDSVLKLYYEALQNLAAYSKHSYRDYTHGLLSVANIDQLRAIFHADDTLDLDKFGMQTIDGFVSAGSYLSLADPKAVNGVAFYNNPLLTIETLLKRNAEQTLDSHTTVAYFLRNSDLNSLSTFNFSDREWFKILDELEDSFVVCALGNDPKHQRYLSKLERKIQEAKKLNDVKTLEELGSEYRAYNPVQLKAFSITNSSELAMAKEANAVLVPRVIYETLYGSVNNFTPINPILRKYNRYVTTMKAFYISSLGTAMRNYVDETIKLYIDVGWEGMPIVHRARFQAMADLSDYYQVLSYIKKDLNTGELIKRQVKNPRAIAHQRLVNKGIVDTPYYFNIPVSDAQKYYGYLAEAGVFPRYLSKRMDASTFLRMHAFMLESASGGTQAGEVQARVLAQSIPKLEGVAARNEGVLGTLGAFLKMKDKTMDSYVSMGNYLFSKGVSAALTPMAYTEQITRLTHMYTLEELGIGKLEAFSRISKTHFNYDIKDRAAVYAQMLIPFFNFIKLNLDYWMNIWTKDAHSIHNILRLNTQNLKEALNDNYEKTRTGQWVDTNYLYQALAGNPRIPNPAGNVGQAAWLKLNPSFYDAYHFLLDPINQGMQDIFSPIQNALQDAHFFDGAIKAGIFSEGYGGNGLRDFLPFIGSTVLPMHENKLRYMDKTYTRYRNDTFAQILKSPLSLGQMPTILAFSKMDFGDDYEKFNMFLNANGYGYDYYTRQIKPLKECKARDVKELSAYMYKHHGAIYDFITGTFIPAYLTKDPVTRNYSYKTAHSTAQWSDIQELAKLYRNKGYDFVSGGFVDLGTNGAIFDRKQYERWQKSRGFEKEYLTNTWVPIGTARAHSYGEAAEYMRTQGMEWDYILKKYVPTGTALAHNYKEANRVYAKHGFEYDYARNTYVPKGRATVNNFNEYKRFQRERNQLEWDYATRQWVPLGTAKASSWKDLYGDHWHKRKHFHKHWKKRKHKGGKFRRFDTWEEVVEFQRQRGLAWDSIKHAWVKLGTEATWDDLVEYKKSKGLGWDRIHKQWVELDKVPTWDEYQKHKESQGYEWDYIQKTWVPKGSAIGKKWTDYQNYKKNTGKTYDYAQQKYIGDKMKTPKAQFNQDFHIRHTIGKGKLKRNYLDSMIHKYINNQDPNVRWNITTVPNLNLYQIKTPRIKRPVPRMRLQDVQRQQTSFVKYYRKAGV